MKTYELHFIGKKDMRQDGFTDDAFRFRTVEYDSATIDWVRNVLMNQAYTHFFWFGPEALKKYGKTRNGNANVFTWEEMAEIAADHGYTMELCEL